MVSKCMDCIYAQGKEDGLVHSPGDNPGDAVWCKNLEMLHEIQSIITKDPKYGWGVLVYRIEVLEEEDTTCEWGVVEG